jgi:cell division protein FtsQ
VRQLGGAVDPRIEQRRIEISRRRGRRRLAMVAAIGALTVAGLGAWFVLHSGLTSAKVVVVVGSEHTPASQVIAVAGLKGKPPLLDVDPGAVAARVERLPWVRTAVVSRRWPDGVRIVVTERTPVAVASAGASWAEVDRTGRVLDVSTARPPGLPQVEAAGHSGPPGTRLRGAARPLLVVSSQLPAAFVAQVASVAESGGQVRLQLTTPISVLLGDPTQLGAKYAAVAAVLAHAVLHPGDVVDVTVPRSPVIAGP